MFRPTTMLFCLLLALPLQALAHPHVFVANRLDFVLAGDRVRHVNVEWEFDAYFAAMIQEDFDLDHDGRLSPAEQEEVRGDAFDHLAESGYFTKLDIDGVESPVRATDFSAEFEGDYILYRFRIPLPDRPMKEVRVSQYDEEYYAALLFSKTDPVRLSGAHEEARFEIRENPDRTYYFGALHPVEARVTLGEVAP